VVGRLAVLDDDEVAVADLLVDHRVALDAKHVAIAFASARRGAAARLITSNGSDRQAGRDVAEQRQFHGPAGTAGRHQFNGSAAIPRAADEAFFLKVAEM